MRNILTIFCAIAALCSCSMKNIPQAMDSSIDKAELNADSFSNEDWEKFTSTFEGLITEYNSSDKEYTEAEKKMAARAMGRYHALLIKEGLGKTEDILGSLGKIIPEYLDGFANELEKGSDNLLKTIESLIDTSSIGSSLDKLGSVLEGIFGPLDEE